MAEQSTTERSKGWLWWTAVLAPLWLMLAWCCYWEPVRGDGWGHLLWHQDNSTSLDTCIEMFKSNYREGNPRIGQVFTHLSYSSQWFHAATMPLVHLALWVLLTALALGRRPKLRQGQDAVVFAVVVACSLYAIWMIGEILFYRPYSTNYVFGFALHAAMLVPYRFALSQNAATSERSLATKSLLEAAKAVAITALGLAAGMGNEHTGPSSIVLMVIAIGLFAHQRRTVRLWMVAGLVAFVVGYYYLYFAPGQKIRYNGLAEQTSITALLETRSVGLLLRIVFGSVVFAFAVALPAMAIVYVRNRSGLRLAWQTQRLGFGFAALGAIMIGATLLASPKLGSRLYVAPTALAIVAAACLIAPGIVAGRRMRALFAAAVLAIVVPLANMSYIYYRVGSENRARYALMRVSQGKELVVPRYSIGRSRYWPGDDFAMPKFARERGYWWNIAGLSVEPE